MRSISGKNTKPELLMRKNLYALGLRYRLHDKTVPGKPDIIFKSRKLVVFVDGDWWHGRNYAAEHHKYTEFWKQKIRKNMVRDQVVNEQLNERGWKVIRVWQKDLEKDPAKYAKLVYDYINAEEVPSPTPK